MCGTTSLAPVPGIVPASCQDRASRANSSQIARSRKLLKRLDLCGQTKMADSGRKMAPTGEARIVSQTPRCELAIRLAVSLAAARAVRVRPGWSAMPGQGASRRTLGAHAPWPLSVLSIQPGERRGRTNRRLTLLPIVTSTRSCWGLTAACDRPYSGQMELHECPF